MSSVHFRNRYISNEITEKKKKRAEDEQIEMQRDIEIKRPPVNCMYKNNICCEENKEHFVHRTKPQLEKWVRMCTVFKAKF